MNSRSQSERVEEDLYAALYGLECLPLRSFDAREQSALLAARVALEKGAKQIRRYRIKSSSAAAGNPPLPALPDDCPACPHGNKTAAGAPVCADCMPELARAIHLSTARRTGAEDQS